MRATENIIVMPVASLTHVYIKNNFDKYTLVNSSTIWYCMAVLQEKI